MTGSDISRAPSGPGFRADASSPQAVSTEGFNPSRAVALTPLHIGAILFGIMAATEMGMPDEIAAARAHHPLWTAAMLVHTVGTDPAWTLGAPRPAASVALAINAARRLTDQALAEIAEAA